MRGFHEALTVARALARPLGLALMVLFLSLPLPAAAVQPDEMLEDPALEARARDISQELRCLVCRNESIDDSNADLARDLRLLVRERLLEGDTDAEVLAYVEERYGPYVRLRPPFRDNPLLWLSVPALFLIGLVIVLFYLRRRRPETTAALDEREKEALQRALTSADDER